jgi:hypothetical protein
MAYGIPGIRSEYRAPLTPSSLERPASQWRGKCHPGHIDARYLTTTFPTCVASGLHLRERKCQPHWEFAASTPMSFRN